MSGAPRRLAAIDIGTVTTRLLVADVTADTIAPVARSTDITHLGQGSGPDRTLDPTAMRRVADVVERYSEMMRELGVEAHLAVATSAARDAHNAEEFVTLLATSGVTPEVISGDAEARLTFSGVTWGMGGKSVLVDDIGGGSTELILGDSDTDDLSSAQIIRARSVDVGSRRLTDAYLTSDPPTHSELESARTHTYEEFRRFFDTLDERPSTLVSVAGTATSLVAMRLGLVEYDPDKVHLFSLGGQDVSDSLEYLAGIPLEQRLQVPGLHPGRAPVIVAGVLILETVMALAGVDSTVVSEHDILYGLLLDSYARLQT